MSGSTADQKRRLDDLLRLPENRECFECLAKQPRWASTNLGIFFCLRCAGLHRAMGTHVSKVRSTNMDTWDEEMIRCCERIGNARARILYERNMPSDVRPKPDTGNLQVERFIREKYEHKKYFHTQHVEMVKMLLSDEGRHISPSCMESSIVQEPKPTPSPSSSLLSAPMLWSNDSTTPEAATSPAPALKVDARKSIDINDLFSGPTTSFTVQCGDRFSQLERRGKEAYGQQVSSTHAGLSNAMGGNPHILEPPPQAGCLATPVDAKTEIMSLFNPLPPQGSAHVYSAWQPKQY